MNVIDYDLAIVGAGPAGLAAAATAADAGLKVALLDEQNTPGGQIYRSIRQPAPADERILGPDYYHGRSLLGALEQPGVDYRPGSTVWAVDEDLSLCLSQDGQSRRVRARRLLIATGAQERPVPFPGWTLPGVMTCGAAQILLKSSALAPAQPLVLAGSGPLLLLIAAQLHRAGVRIEAILDTTPRQHYATALKHLPGALRNLPLLTKGLGLLRELKRAGIRRLTNVSALEAVATSDGNLNAVRFNRGKERRELPCTTLLVHQGVVPNVQLTRALGLAHDRDELQQCWRPAIDAWGESSRAGIFVAGDSAGIAGALAAEAFGRLVALQAAHQLGHLSAAERDTRARQAQTELGRQRAIRPFLDALYRPAQAFLTPPDETIVCRCEEVTAGELRRMVDDGCRGPNQTKAFCRAGMGPCQGRLCGLTVSQVIADQRGVPVDEVGYYQVRMPIKPLTLGELADTCDA
ncbi:MAG: FAD-dependent oxidoreductase [Oceanospirillaceae bacterium]|nr:FAD-dependent oxidoreductase [Oceanospirillaceae bacterium]